jgi:hypothetical protein
MLPSLTVRKSKNNFLNAYCYSHAYILTGILRLDPKNYFLFLPNDDFNANFLLVGVLSGNAIERINDSPLIEVILTDSIPIQNMPKFSPKITVLSVAHLMGEAIRRIHNEESVSSLFQFS